MAIIGESFELNENRKAQAVALQSSDTLDVIERQIQKMRRMLNAIERGNAGDRQIEDYRISLMQATLALGSIVLNSSAITGDTSLDRVGKDMIQTATRHV